MSPRRRPGNTVRESTAAPEDQVINNLPGLYPTENWRAEYWSVEPDGELTHRTVIVQLPRGLSAICPPVTAGLPGCVQMVRRWGFAVYPSLLEELHVDLPQIAAMAGSRYASASSDVLRVALDMTHFDLPGHFIIASDEHPFLLYDPQGTLKGSYTRWRTYLGALAFLLTEGKVNSHFLQFARDAHDSYEMALGWLKEAVRRGRGQAQ